MARDLLAGFELVLTLEYQQNFWKKKLFYPRILKLNKNLVS